LPIFAIVKALRRPVSRGHEKTRPRIRDRVLKDDRLAVS